MQKLSLLLALKDATKRLTLFSDTPKLDAEILLAHVLQKSRSALRASPELILTASQYQSLDFLITQRTKKIPVAYLVGEKEFWSLKFKVTPDVLIPRPDTEILVEKILMDYANHDELTLIDVGTGSGAIAIALAHEKPNWNIIASDISENALAIAKENALSLLAPPRITFIHSHWFDQFSDDLKADIIVSNPPYLAEDDPHLLDTEISHEPKLALLSQSLNSGSGPGLTPVDNLGSEMVPGTESYWVLAEQAKHFLKPQGRLYVEHGCEQSKSVTQIFKQCGYQNTQTIQDLARLERITMGTYAA